MARSVRRLRVPTTLLALPCASGPALADTRLVPAEYPTIQAAIDASIDGDIVLVADGVYTGLGNRDISFGGRAITVRSENGPDACIIDVQGSGHDPHRAFSFHSDEDDASVVEGFTMQNGFMDRGGAVSCTWGGPLFRACIFQDNTAWTDSEDDGGGAVYVAADDSVYAPTFLECRFLRNHAETNVPETGGGAIKEHGGYLTPPLRSHAGVTLIDCSFRENSATGPETSFGGAMHCENIAAVAELTGCDFESNLADNGGALAIGRRSDVMLLNCGFRGNVARIGGGAVDCFATGLGRVTLVVASSQFVSNTAGSGGALALRTRTHDTATLINCTFSRNEAQEGGAIYSTDGGTVFNSILWEHFVEPIADVGGDLVVAHSNVQGGWPGVGNIDADPLFVDADNGDFSLSPYSPCIDAADNTALPEGMLTDLAGNPRFHDDPWVDDTGIPGGEGGDAVVDMGAYEFQGASCSADFSGDGLVDFADYLEFLNLYDAQDPRADFNGDGLVDFADYLEFLNLYEAGC